MRLLHTSDWHLGRTLYGKKRYPEFVAFLDWLIRTLETEKIDALLVSGDVFDTGTPANRAQQLYYRFLCRAAASGCRHVIITAGNHDSPSFLNAPRELLSALDVHVSAAAAPPEQQVLVLEDEKKQPRAIVCAVPYLRDRDIRTVSAGESADAKQEKMSAGIAGHYERVCALAGQIQQDHLQDGGPRLPVIAMGHLFTAGGRTLKDDGVRELTVGTLDHVGTDIFPECIDYLALGHLHIPQTVAGREHMRYCGSPIPMGFGEAGQPKTVIRVDFKTREPEIQTIAVPCFQPLVRIRGPVEEICRRIEALRQENSRAWLEIEYTGKTPAGDLRQKAEEAVQGSDMEIRRIKNRQLSHTILTAARADLSLDDLTETQVFTRCLERHEIPEASRDTLIRMHDRMLRSVQEADPHAE